MAEKVDIARTVEDVRRLAPVAGDYSVAWPASQRGRPKAPEDCELAVLSDGRRVWFRPSGEALNDVGLIGCAITPLTPPGDQP